MDNENKEINLNDDNNEKNESKVFSEDYVKALRGEAKQNRLQVKNYETKLKQILGLKEDEDIADLDNKINVYKSSITKVQEEKMNKAKELLYKTELKGLESNYNTKLVEKLLDKSKIVVDDDGNVTGLKEAIKLLETDFPEILKNNNNSNPGANPGGNFEKKDVSKMSMEEYMEEFQKRNK